MDENNQPLRVRTGVRAGTLADQVQQGIDQAMFALFDALQKPTDWLYNALGQPPERKP